MQFKCKICGGVLEVPAGATVGDCPYCGMTMTLPKLSGKKRANLYERANAYRRTNDYDRAMAVYETILGEDPSDAETYWSIVLCKYGIEYVEDPKTRKRIPTCNRTRTLSIFADEDYRQAIACASGEARAMYEEEAETIDAIQKNILDVSNREKPFDVFICYKETDSRGRRTPDSVIAQELYDELTKKGYHVFFSRITLENKLGEAYEPYIFAALNTARVMVVAGSRKEYFESVWVRNEWNRYLTLIRDGAKKTLVPAYKSMDVKDLPDEFEHLQAQNMNNLGFMQDLVRGIEKIIPLAPPSPVDAAGTDIGTAQAAVRRETALRIDETTQTVTGISGAPGSTIVIPGEIKAIAPGAFADLAGITSVTIEPGNLKSIPERAFAGCRDMENLGIPQTLVSISREAFSGCAKLCHIYYSWVTVHGKIHIRDTNAARLASIGARAFAGCDSLSKIDLPESFTTLGNEAFADCRNLEEAYFDSLKTVGERAFAGCVKLSSVCFAGENGASISRGAFSGCVSLKEVSFSTGSKKWNIDEEAFMGCTSIAKLEFEEGLRKIRKNAFAGCTGLKNIIFYDEFGVEVEEGAFAGCTGLQSINIGAAAIAPGAFEGCGNIKNINFEKDCKLKSLRWLAPFFEQGTPPRLGGIQSIYYIDEGAFEGCDFLLSTLKLPPKGVVDIGKNAFAGLPLKDVAIPAEVRSIGEGAFARCTSLESVVFRGHDTESIGNGAFAGCDNLELIYLQDQTAKLYREKKIVIDHPAVCADAEQFRRITRAKQKKIVIPKDTDTIEEGAFKDCTGVKSVTIPPNIKRIEESAFEGCTGLEELVIPAGVREIGRNAFRYCTGLKSLTLTPVYEIDTGTFAGCSGLKRLVIPAGVTVVQNNAFADCTGLEEIVFPEGVHVFEGAFYGCTGLRKLVLPKYSRFYAGAFEGCTGLQKVSAAGSVRIHPETFAGCAAMSRASRRRMWRRRHRKALALVRFLMIYIVILFIVESVSTVSGAQTVKEWLSMAIDNIISILSLKTFPSSLGTWLMVGYVLPMALLFLFLSLQDPKPPQKK